MTYISSFFVGGLICAIGQIMIDKFGLTVPKVLVSFVVSGTILGFLGIYEPIVNFAGQGATLPLPGFGYALSKGVIEEIKTSGMLGIISGGLKATSLGIGAVLTLSFVCSVIFNPREK